MPSLSSSQVGPIERFMAQDHNEVDSWLRQSLKDDGSIDEVAYTRFRERLVRHIALEEKVLLRYARAKTGAPIPFAAALKRDHVNIVRLLASPPTKKIFVAVVEALADHAAFEEGPAGLYATCDEIAGDDAENVVARLRTHPEVAAPRRYEDPEAHR